MKKNNWFDWWNKWDHDGGKLPNWSEIEQVILKLNKMSRFRCFGESFEWKDMFLLDLPQQTLNVAMFGTRSLHHNVYFIVLLLSLFKMRRIMTVFSILTLKTTKPSQKMGWTKKEDNFLRTWIETKTNSDSVICWEEIADNITKKVSSQPRTSLDCKRRWFSHSTLYKKEEKREQKSLTH